MDLDLRMTEETATLPVAPEPTPREGSYELKILLEEPQVEPVMAWARERIPPDVHANTPGDDTYLIHSLYFDTDDFDVFHRSRGYADRKYRIRRYGSEPLLYLEQKSKVKGWVQKQRTPIPEGELSRLVDQESPAWAGDWFRSRLREQHLEPRCEVMYRRLARVGEADGEPVRLTLDREIYCAPALGLELGEPDRARFSEIQRTILELKFRDALPRLFKELIREFELEPTSSSKYRRAITLCGLASDEGGA